MAQQYEPIIFATDTGEEILVEATAEPGREYIETLGEREMRKSKISLEKALSLIAPIANGVVSAIDAVSTKPDTFEVSFKIALTGGLDIKLVKLSGEANMDVKVTWKG